MIYYPEIIRDYLTFADMCEIMDMYQRGFPKGKGGKDYGKPL